MPSSPHPFDPLTPREISQASRVIRDAFPGQTINFRVVTLREPLKKEMVLFLEREDGESSTAERPARVARAQVETSLQGRVQLHELLVDLDQCAILKRDHLEGKHCYIDSAYMQAVEKACRADEDVQAEIRTLELPANATVVIEPWAYATDGMNDMSERVTMVRNARPL